MAAAPSIRSSRIRRPLALAGGALALVALAAPLQSSGAAFTASTVNAAGGIAAAPDWTPPAVDLPTLYAIRNGTVVTATATDGETGIREVRIEWAPSGTTGWAAVCTRTAAPYSCPVATAGMPADIDLRATATDGAGYSATDLLEDVAVDDVAPTASFTVNNPKLSGVAPIEVTASDAQTYVTSVTMQYRLGTTGTLVNLCTATTPPWRCSFDTTKVADGAYTLVATATDLAGNQATTTTSATVDNRNASVSVIQPNPNFLRGTAALVEANAFSNVAISSVELQYSPNGTSGWARICLDTTAPYACSWDTTKLADGTVHLRAILIDAKGATTSATVTSTIDNSPFRGFDVQALNGGLIGRMDAGDRVTLTYNRTLNPTSILAGWSGGTQAVTLRLRDGATVGLGGTDDTLDVVTGTNLNNPTLVPLGSVNLKTDQVKPRATVAFSGTITLGTTTVNGLPASTVTIAVGAQTAGRAQELRTSSIGPTMVWTPSNLARDTTGAASSTAPITELGPADRDL